MNEKKVIAVIVEGPSDEAALGSVMKEYFSRDEIQFVVVHGDITTKDYVSTDNILSKINNLIESVKQKYGYHADDFLQLIHIVDMDGAFCNGVIYRIYFNSCNLEHVLYNELKEFTDNEKADMADDFAEKYEGKTKDFIEFISQEDLIAPGTFKETWRFIEKEKHSLERFTNMHLIFK